MRPLRLELEGFLAYRDRTSIEFDGVDLFVLEGATGSGKSSVIDGMIIALYGTIPRLGNRAAVAPVINATVDSARVSFDFTIGDDVYTVARRVDRTAGGATVPFFAVRDASGRVHVALDACQACAVAKKGYVQAGDAMKCRNCGMTFPVAQITEMGDRGGCHPILLPATASGDAIVVEAADVAAGAKWF